MFVAVVRPPDHRLEVDERVVPGGVPVAGDGVLRVVWLFSAGCPQAAASRVAMLPIPCSYAFQVWPLAVSWSPIVLIEDG